MKLKKKFKFKSQTVVFHTLWGCFCLFFWTHRFKFLCNFEHLCMFLGTMLGSVDSRGVWKRQHGAPQRWSRGWKLIEGIVEHPCVRYSCSICRPVSNDSVDGTDTWKVTLCTNSCQDERQSLIYILNRLTMQMEIKVGGGWMHIHFFNYWIILWICHIQIFMKFDNNKLIDLPWGVCLWSPTQR